MRLFLRFHFNLFTPSNAIGVRYADQGFVIDADAIDRCPLRGPSSLTATRAFGQCRTRH